MLFSIYKRIYRGLLMHRLMLLCFIFLGLPAANGYAVEIIKHNGLNESLDGHKYYFASVLQLAIDKSMSQFGPAKRQVVNLPMEQQRQFKSLDDNILDVMWAMTSIKIEKDALPVRIPLLKGLLGYRVFVVRKSQQQIFSAITELSQLKKLTAVQGYGWSDVQILRDNGFKVEESSWYNTIYKSLNSGFYDYYPRSVLEVWSEFEQNKYDNLAIDTQHLLIYPAAIYFFVNKNNEKLAQRLEFGLLQALADGSFESLFNRYPQHVDAINKLQTNRRLIHHIDNPTLPIATPLGDERLWFTTKAQ